MLIHPVHKRAFKVLKTIENNPGRSLIELSKLTGITSTKLCVYTTFFAKNGWIDTENFENKKLHKITPKGVDSSIALELLIKNKMPDGVEFLV